MEQISFERIDFLHLRNIQRRLAPTVWSPVLLFAPMEPQILCVSPGGQAGLAQKKSGALWWRYVGVRRRWCKYLKQFRRKICIARALRNCGLWARLLWVPGVFSRMGKLKRWNCQDWQNNFKVEKYTKFILLTSCDKWSDVDLCFKSRL